MQDFGEVEILLYLFVFIKMLFIQNINCLLHDD